MLDLRRLRLLYELRERRTIAAVAEALSFTPSAVSQQLAALEREAGVALLERAGRGVRLTDAGIVLAGHAERLLDGVRLAEAELASAAERVAGRVRVASFQSVALNLAIPAIRDLAVLEPALRCELIEAEPESSLPALTLGDVDVVLADEWQHQPRPLLPGVDRHDLFRDPVHVVLPEGHPVAERHPERVPLAELAGDVWSTGHPGTGWEEVIAATCRRLGGFEPDLRHRANDAQVSLALVAHGIAVTLLPGFVRPGRHPGVVLREIDGEAVDRVIFAATRATDRARPSTQAVLAAVRRQMPRPGP